MADGATDPPDWCVSTIARLAIQPGAPADAVERVQARLADACPGQFLYPPASLHVSLLGCTPRRTAPATFGAGQVARIRDACAGVLGGARRVELGLRGIGVQGCQVFAQAIPDHDTWAHLRAELEDALMAARERPIGYPDKRPIHLNLLRMTDAAPEALDRMLAAVERLRDEPLGALAVSRVELVVTDFVVSRRHTRTLETFALG